MHGSWRGILAASALGALGGCGFHQSPSLRVTELRLATSDDGGAVVTMVVEASNPGDEALPLGLATYELSFAGERVYRGQWETQATAPARGSVLFELPATMTAAEVPGPEGAEYALRGVVEYVPPGALGEALFDARLRRGSASFRERGRLGGAE